MVHNSRTPQTTSYWLIASAGIVVVAIIIGIWIMNQDNTPVTSSTTSTTQPPMVERNDTNSTSTTSRDTDNLTDEPSRNPSEVASKYRDGTYTARGKYDSPAGKESIDVTVTITNNKVTSILIKDNATHPRSIQYNRLFSEAIRGEVVGKDIQDINVGRLNSASLTPNGFNNALQVIKQQATQDI